MRALIVLDHPWDRSFCHALKNALVDGLHEAGHHADVIDLHADAFDPVMHREELAGYTRGLVLDPLVTRYQDRIRQARHLVFVFPLWWEVTPAMLKGWLDKVLLPGFAFREADAAPLLTHLVSATAITTMGAPEITYNSVERALLYGTMRFCGVRHTHYINFLDVGNSTLEQRARWLEEVREYGRTLDTRFPSDGE